jgi:hypothetical protein
VPFLGAVPLDPRIAKCCDFGESFIDEFPDSIATKAFLSVVEGSLSKESAHNRLTAPVGLEKKQYRALHLNKQCIAALLKCKKLVNSKRNVFMSKSHRLIDFN